MLLLEDRLQNIQTAIRKGRTLSADKLPTESFDSQKERARKWIVTLIFIVYWLLIFEGALRKWALPEAHSILFFIRDPFVLAAYVLTVKYKLWATTQPHFQNWHRIGHCFHTACSYSGINVGRQPVSSRLWMAQLLLLFTFCLHNR